MTCTLHTGNKGNFPDISSRKHGFVLQLYTGAHYTRGNTVSKMMDVPQIK